MDTANYSTVSGTVGILIYRVYWYVKPNGSGDGTSWASPLGNIQTAIDEADAWVGGEIWVAAGTYTGTTFPIVTMKTDVRLFGGFAGTETDLATRNWRVNPTIIDGGGTRTCVYGADTATIDGFIIQNAGNGGCGMRNHGVSPTITNCTFRGNSANYTGGDGYGGGMSNDSSAAPVINNCFFIENSASYGGAMINHYASPALTNCVFYGNTASIFGGAIYNNYEAAPSLVHCTFSGNTATSRGGGMYNNYSSAPVLTNCVIWGNSAVSGGNEILDYVGVDYPSSTTTVTYSCVGGGFTGTGNISTNPLFEDAANDDYRLQTGSPCIDMGTIFGLLPGTDILGVARPQGTGFDMGAYEYPED